MHEIDINQRLSFFQNQINQIYNKLLSDGIHPTKELIKSSFLSNEFYDKKKENIFDIFDLFINNYTNNGIRPGIRTIQRYEVLKRKLKEFVNFKKYNITLQEINMNFKNEFIAFLLKKQITNNTVGSYIKNLKLFMSWSSDQEYHSNFEFRKFKVFKKDTFQVSLDDDEIKQIQQLDLSNIPHLKNSRDMFILQCNLGLRYSDLIRLNNTHINLIDDFIEIVSQKTHSFQIIPLSECAIGIIKKYETSKFPFISDQKQNKNIKEICKLSGINKIVNDYKEIGSKVIEVPKPKYELISTHTARRTFITKMKMLGLPDDLIKLSTGH